MTRNFLKIYIFATILLSDIMMFADDDPGTGLEDENGDTGGTVEFDSPINSKLVWLAIAGILFAYIYFKTKDTVTHEE